MGSASVGYHVASKTQAATLEQPSGNPGLLTCATKP